MIIYDFLSAKQVILINVRTDFNLTQLSFGQLLTELTHIMTTYDLLLAIGYTSDSEQCSNRVQLDLICIFFNLFIGGQIMTRYDFWKSDFEQCLNRLQLYLI